MFIELTDHLRCTEQHAEQFLVLLPGAMEGRRVVGGELGCPVCGKVVVLAEGVADFGGGTPSAGAGALSAEAIAAFLGLSGPGGWVALVGNVSVHAGALAERLPGVRLVLVNPPSGTPDSLEASVLRARRLPLKQGSMRGAVVGGDFGCDPAWVADAAGAVLGGLRMVVEGGEPPRGVELLARAEGCWVGRRLKVPERGAPAG
jgi:hypothetical protein